jgi:hypothetical protein
MRDPIGEYLTVIGGRLRMTPQDKARVLAEAEDHLAEAVAAGTAAGLTEREAQEAAISSFGSVDAVVRAHNARLWRRRPAALVGDLTLAAWKLGSLVLIAVGASGLLVAAMNAVFGRPFTGAAPAGTRFAAAACPYWQHAWPGAHGCAQAAMLEASSDNVVLRVAAGIVGVLLLSAYVLARMFLRRRGREPAILPEAFFPAAAVCSFGAACLVLCWLTMNRLAGNPAMLGFHGGPGSFLSGAIAALAVAAVYLLPLGRSVLRSARG